VFGLRLWRHACRGVHEGERVVGTSNLIYVLVVIILVLVALLLLSQLI
jgi:hypothetical protein